MSSHTAPLGAWYWGLLLSTPASPRREEMLIQYSQIREEAQEVEPRSSSWTKPTFGPIDLQANAGRAFGLLETGEVEAMEIAGSNAETSTAFLRLVNHPGPLVVIWDNGPDRGAFVLTTPDLHLRLLTGLQPRLQCRRSRLGLGQGRDGQRMPEQKPKSKRR